MLDKQMEAIGITYKVREKKKKKPLESGLRLKCQITSVR